MGGEDEERERETVGGGEEERVKRIYIYSIGQCIWSAIRHWHVN